MPTKYPFFKEGEEPEQPAKRLACSGLREDLKECLLASDCVRKEGKTPKQCLAMGTEADVPMECHFLRQSFFECKRSILDMRSRFRGPKGY